MSLPQPEAVDRCLQAAGALAGAAECHGLLCGLLCSGAREPLRAWCRELFQAEVSEPPPPLDALAAATLKGLDDEEFGLELLLPPDSTALAERTAALSDWCSGFAFGAAAGDGEIEHSADAREFIQDVTEIARVVTDPGDDDLEEGAYAELVEYLRVGALLMRTESRQRASAASANDNGEDHGSH